MSDREYRDPEKWLTPELSIGQQLELERLTRSVSSMPRQELEEMLPRAVKAMFGYQNMVKGLLKKG